MAKEHHSDHHKKAHHHLQKAHHHLSQMHGAAAKKEPMAHVEKEPVAKGKMHAKKAHKKSHKKHEKE